MRSTASLPYVPDMTTRVATPPDQRTVQRLSEAFNRCFETFDAGEDVFADDAFFDLLPPLWRFQLVGPAAFAAQLRAIAEGEVTARVLRVVPTATGFVLEHEESMRGDELLVARRLWLCEVSDGRITEVTGYCNGGWDEELRARHAAEAPMVRA
jgi:ketosteroid isomerase-like protein